VKEFNEFLASIHNEQVPEKKAAWKDLILAWRENLVAAKQGGALDAADAETMRTAIREAAKDRGGNKFPKIRWGWGTVGSSIC